MPVKRPMKITDLFRFKAPGRVAISPAGDRVVFELKRFDYDKNKNFVNLMMVDAPVQRADWLGANGGDQPGGIPASREEFTPRSRCLTRGDRVDLSPKWSPDGRRLAFTSDRDKGRCLFVLDLDGGEPRRLTSNDGGVSDFAWSPDGRSIAFAWHPMTEREKLERDDKADEIKKMAQFKHIKRLHHKLDGAGWWNGLYTHIHILRVDDESGAGGWPKPKQLTFGEFEDSEPRFSPDGRLVSFVSNRVENPDLNLENTDIYVVRAAGGGTKKLTRGPGLCQGHAWSPDGKTIAYIGHPAKAGEDWKYNVRVWLLPAGGGESTELTKEIDNHCANLTLGDVAFASFEPTAPMWSSDSARVSFVVSEAGATRLYSRSIDQRDTRLEVGGDVNIYYVHQASPGGPIAMCAGTSTNPGDVYVFDPASQPSPARDPDQHPQREQRAGLSGESAPLGSHAPTNATRLTRVNREVLDTLIITPPEPFSAQSGDSSSPVTVHGWIIKPPNFDLRRKYPAILQIHGGPHAQYGHCMFHEMQAMAASGYVVCFANPRGSAGYGLKFMNCIHADWGNVDYQDLMKVADWLFSRPYVDRKRVGVTGGSYGGYMTNWIVGHTNRFAAAVSQRGVVNFESSFGCSDFGWWWAAELGGTPWGARERYYHMAPLTYARNIKTPLLIEHEEQDHRCTIEQAEQLFTTLKYLGREVEMVRFEGESHGLSRTGRPKNREARLKFIKGWMDRYLKARR